MSSVSLEILLIPWFCLHITFRKESCLFQPQRFNDSVSSIPASLLLGKASLAALSLDRFCSGSFYALQQDLGRGWHFSLPRGGSRDEEGCWGGVGVSVCSIHLQGVFLGKRLVTQKGRERSLWQCHGCSWQRWDNVKSLSESGKDFARRESSEWGSGGEVCGELLPQGCAHPRCPVKEWWIWDLRDKDVWA